MTTDLDKSGPFTKRAGQTYLGPSLGAVNSQTNVLTITTTGLNNVDLNVTQIQVNAAGLVTIQLPSSLDRTTKPSTYVDSPIAITDISGLAATNIITILPFAGELIAGAASALVSSNYGAVVLAPISTGGWTVLSYSTPADTGGGYVAKSGDTMTGNLLINASPVTGMGISVQHPGVTGTIAGSQTAPNQGNAGMVYSEVYVANDQAAVTGGGLPQTSAMNICLQTGGVDTGQKFGLNVFLFQAIPSTPATGRDHVAISGICRSDYGDGGTGVTVGTAKGTVFGGSFYGLASPNAVNMFAVTGAEFGAALAAGATTYIRFGVSSVSLGLVQAAGLDAAYELGATSISWKNGLLFTSAHGVAPVDTTGTMIGTDGVPATVLNGIDLSDYTMTNFLLGPSGFIVDGSANITANSLDLPAWTVVGSFPISSATGGAYTTAAAQGRYKKIGKTYMISMYITITTVGPGTGAIRITLPETCGVLHGVIVGFRTNDMSILTGIALANTTTLDIYLRDGSTPAMDAGVYNVNGSFEIA